MSTHTGFGNCPQCKTKGTLMEEYDGNGEMSKSCCWCGYSQWTTNVIDGGKRRQRSLKAPLTFKRATGKNGKSYIQRRCYTRRGTGVVFVGNRQGGGVIYPLKIAMTEAQIESFKDIFQDPKVDENRTFVTRFDEGSGEVSVVVGNRESAWLSMLLAVNPELPYHEERS